MDDELSSLERDFPAWHIWRSQAGRWWATRLGPAGLGPAGLGSTGLGPAGPPGGQRTLDADTSAELRQALARQP